MKDLKANLYWWLSVIFFVVSVIVYKMYTKWQYSDLLLLVGLLNLVISATVIFFR